MALPKIEHPVFTLKVPSTQKNVKFRPFLVKEEKLLLMAKASEQEADLLQAIKQVVNNCAIDKIDIDKFSLFDIEYLFLRIRAQSVNNIVSVSYKDFEDNNIYDFDIDLNEVEVQFPETVDKTIQITDKVGIVMKYPDASLYNDKEFLQSGDEAFYQLILRCIEKFYDADGVYSAKNVPMKEIEDFVENLDVKTFDKVRDFMTSQPKLHYEIKYKNTLGNERKIELSTLTDFFTLR